MKFNVCFPQDDKDDTIVVMTKPNIVIEIISHGQRVLAF